MTDSDDHNADQRVRWVDSLPEELHRLARDWLAAQPLPAENEGRLWQRLRIEWNYNSNHIEGNTLTYGETLLLLIHGRTRGEHLLREYEEMRGHDVAIELVRSLAREERQLGEGDLRDLNRIVLKEGFWRVAQTPGGEPTRKWIEPGRYKTQPNHVITATGELFHFATPEETPARMADLVQWLRGEMQTPTLALPELLARLHHNFVRIHPFDDGNGRVVRLLINFVLLRAGLLPLIVKSRDRRRYLETIAQADAGDLTGLAEFFAAAMGWSLRLGLEASRGLIELQPDDE
ncbi:Fic family protein [Thioalkalivibrio paradoxus]|uniref:Fic protein n=1 Tax=Thioalkalivibrio paradoxus ARh 1 TaxID=713585 RepID=W0DK20_9GAMM|nr:Fic family protein [Thioalkalivibrio paradoxus]AHE97225.1 Fic protein [Thioalkalivibrio paradoxus ARh 1]